MDFIYSYTFLFFSALSFLAIFVLAFLMEVHLFEKRLRSCETKYNCETQQYSRRLKHYDIYQEEEEKYLHPVEDLSLYLD